MRIIDVSWHGHCIEHLPTLIAQRMQCIAEELPRARLAKAGSFLAQQTHAPMANWLAQGNRLRISQEIAFGRAWHERCRTFEEGSGEQMEHVQASYELFVGDQVGEAIGVVILCVRIRLHRP